MSSTITINIPELAALAEALSAHTAALNGGGVVAPIQTGADVIPPPPAAPVASQAPVAPQTAAVPVAAPAVPVAAPPTFSREQIMNAGAALVDAGKMNELITLLNMFGAQAVTQLKQEQLGAFATEMRKLGAQI